MARITDKINLPTNTTNIFTLANYLKEIDNVGVLTKSNEQEIFAKVKIEGSRKNVTNPKGDTHNRAALAMFGLVDINDEDESMRVSQLGRELLKFVDNRDLYEEEDRIALMLKIFFRLEIKDSKRSVHVGLILSKLMLDSDLDYYVTNQEFAEFVSNSNIVSDEQYLDIKKQILNFRSSKIGISEFVSQTKAGTFLSTFVKNWGILTANKEDLTSNQMKLAHRYFSDNNDTIADILEDDVELTDDIPNDLSPSQKNAWSAFHTIKIYRLNSLAAYIARIYLAIIDNVILKNYTHTFAKFPLKSTADSNSYTHYLTALRTKPFLLLAGISGTGKSRIVRKLAQSCVTKELQEHYDAKSIENGFDRWQLHKPANFELVQVKPNWHNSLEVVGYKSNIGGAHYEFTPFVRFVARAWKHPEVPFFLCLDEMNLAPVEQYFAEFLSAIESRSMENGMYETDPIIKPFSEFGDDVCNQMLDELVGKVDASSVGSDSLEVKLIERFRSKGLTLPENLLVLGTVNMDETTFSFSRKVLDRAMSIVMNDVEYDKFFSGESENDIDEMSQQTMDLLIKREIRGVNAPDNDSAAVESYLTAINNKLDNTPFKLGYRAANEALLYVSATHLMTDKSTEEALDEFTMMKILSRIEGDKRSIGKILTDLKNVITEDYPKSHKKLVEMEDVLTNKQFVSYWN